MKLVTVNGKQYQECDIVMLGTSKTNNLNDIVLNSDKTKLATLNPLTVGSKQSYTNQHLYILSNDEIKEGDWVYNKKHNWLKQVDKHYLLLLDYNDKKIFATTDTSLETITSGTMKLKDGSYGFTTLKPFEIPTTLIQQYINAYNNRNVVEKCFVEVEEKFIENNEKYIHSSGAEGKYSTHTKQIKLNENNEISILLPTVEQNVKLKQLAELLERADVRKYTCINKFGYSQLERDIVDLFEQKQMFSRKEVEVLLFNLAEHYAMTSTKQEINDFNNWIKENLK